MMAYFDRSPYAEAKRQRGADALIAHFRHRQEVELRLCAEIFREQAVILRSKAVDWSKLPV